MTRHLRLIAAPEFNISDRPGARGRPASRRRSASDNPLPGSLCARANAVATATPPRLRRVEPVPRSPRAGPDASHFARRSAT